MLFLENDTFSRLEFGLTSLKNMTASCFKNNFYHNIKLFLSWDPSSISKRRAIRFGYSILRCAIFSFKPYL